MKPEDIVEIKPGLAGVRVNVRALLRRLMVKPAPASIVAKQFLTLFDAHGVAPTQIQQFLPQLTLDKLNSVEALLAALTNNVLDDAAKLFKVRREWLDGVDSQIYHLDFCYKAPKRFFEALAALGRHADEFPVRALYATRRLDCRAGRPQPLALLLVEKVRDLGEEEICRYVIFHDGWDWGYSPSRIQLKAMARVVDRVFGQVVPLYPVESSVLEAVRGGRLIPRACLCGSPITEPSLEDYALSPAESHVAKECEELPAVEQYIKANGLEALALRRKRGKV
jgi:hypothetical protein